MGSRANYRSLAVLVAVNVLNFYDRNVIGALTEPIRKEFGLSDAQVGLIGSAFIWLYAIVGLPLGRAADSWSRKKLLASGMLVWAALTGVAAMAANYTMLLFSRLGFAVGEAVVAPAATSWIGDLFPATARSRPLALFMLGVPVGGALTYFFSGPVAQAYGWRAAIVVAAAPAAVLIPFLLRLTEPVRGAAESHHEAMAKASMAAILKIPTMWWIIASGALLNFNMYALGSFQTSFFMRYHGIEITQAGRISALVSGVGALGLFAGGWLGDLAFRRGVSGRLHVAWLGSAAAIPCLLLALAVPRGQAWSCAAWLLPASVLLYTYYGTVYATIQDIIEPGLRGTAMAIYFCAMYVFAVFGPVATGWLSDYCARWEALGEPVADLHKALGLHDAMHLIPVLEAALVVVLFAASRTVAGDHRRLRKRMQAAAGDGE